jgi:hypothetical protein
MKLPILAFVACSLLAGGARAADLSTIDPKASVSLGAGVTDHAPGSCHYREAANGMPLPDANCSPGAINPTLTLDVLNDPQFRTGVVRDKVTSEAQKRKVFEWYGITPPANNTGQTQTCELDHIVDLSAGGADTLDNIFPQCQRPTDPAVPVGNRWFKLKDRFAEHVMIAAVKSGKLTPDQLADMQRKIAADWTQFLPTGH